MTTRDRLITRFELSKRDQLAAPHLSAERFLARTKKSTYSPHYPLPKHYDDPLIANKKKKKAASQIEAWYRKMGLDMPTAAVADTGGGDAPEEERRGDGHRAGVCSHHREDEDGANPSTTTISQRLLEQLSHVISTGVAK
jgi:hypothetical protein